GNAFIRDELDRCAAEVEVDETERRAGPLDAVAGPHPEAQHLGVERFGLFRLVGDDLDMVDPFEHGSLAVVGSMLAFPRPPVGAATAGRRSATSRPASSRSRSAGLARSGPMPSGRSTTR